TADRTYEDITSVMPIVMSGEITGALIVSMSIEDLKTTIAHATGYSSRYSLYSMVGETPEFLQLQHKAMRIARNDHNVLLQGEPGTGKQRLAHGIHQASSRAVAPLICIKCRYVDPAEIREELFGNNVGNKKITGKLELACGGTLFLDEVEKLPVEIGDEIAAALSNKKKYNVRLILACDSTLKRLTDKGLFSRNLYDMVAGTSIRVMPLRERSKDIEAIVEHILAEMSAQHNLPPKRLSPEALTMLINYEWPGNIKQLQGVIEGAFFHTSSNLIEADNVVLPNSTTMEKSWKSNKEAFISMWKAAGGNISHLASMLDVSRVTLYRYLKKYGLSK
ncbi:MAG: sigma 54-interacting transcriptional regulator, partial [Acidaminococcaceae bacterium]|nr:sigma 54-interacting transcriptional regulator [Acidaminococcaceae bacterium]